MWERLSRSIMTYDFGTSFEGPFPTFFFDLLKKQHHDFIVTYIEMSVGMLLLKLVGILLLESVPEICLEVSVGAAPEKLPRIRTTFLYLISLWALFTLNLVWKRGQKIS